MPCNKSEPTAAEKQPDGVLFDSPLTTRGTMRTHACSFRLHLIHCNNMYIIQLVIPFSAAAKQC
jgi:hypothetical protein